MSKTIKIAAIQMKANPAPVLERLARAEKLIAQSARDGAQFVILPEVFNTGYEYSDKNYSLAETFEGPTTTWMRKTAAQQNIHLAGSFLRRQNNEIFNTLLLIAPNGKQWHYDKNYPWMWERAYFKNGTGATIADTALGKIGLLICWDVSHTQLWRRYAGQVDLMAISSCPPKVLDLSMVFPNGQRMAAKEAGALIQYLKRSSDDTFGKYLRRQGSWLGVPLVNTSGAGTFATAIPNPKLSMLMIALMVPALWKFRSQFGRVRIETGYFAETYIADASGKVLQQVQPDAEAAIVSEVSLADTTPQPAGKQPPFGIAPFSYLLDNIVNRFMAPVYKRNTKSKKNHRSLS